MGLEKTSSAEKQSDYATDTISPPTEIKSFLEVWWRATGAGWPTDLETGAASREFSPLGYVFKLLCHREARRSGPWRSSWIASSVHSVDLLAMTI